MRKSNIQTLAYIGLLIVLAGLVVSLSLRYGNSRPLILSDVAFLLILATLAEGYSLKLNRNFATTAVPPVHIAAIFLLPPPAVITVVLISITINEILDGQKPYKIVFNMAHHVITSGVPALLVQISGEWGNLRHVDKAELYLVVGLVICLYYVLDVALVDLVIALNTRDSALRVWRDVNRKSLILDITLASLGIVMAIVWLQSPVFCLLLLFPIMVNQDAFRSLHRLEQETQQAIIDITELVEARDPYTFGHSLRVAGYCRAIAHELGLNEEDVDRIALAGRVHDLGKIGVSDHILQKPGKLNELEWIEMRKHAETGASILSNYSSYREGVRDVLYHHESWDGSGYPAKIAGEQIPLGARIIAVADSFDAMTTDRPYRKGMPIGRSLKILQDRRGIQWDPKVVDAFVAVIKNPRAYPEVAVLLPRQVEQVESLPALLTIPNNRANPESSLVTNQLN